MSNPEQLSSLLNKWDELREQGTEITPEDLCRDYPDLLPELKRRIAAVQSFENRFAQDESTEDYGTSEETLRDKSLALPSVAGRYQLEAEIARGGMGMVVRALDPDFDRPLAVKIVLSQPGTRPDLERRLFEEARITAWLQHPGIAPVHEMGRLEDGRPFFAMKLIEGQTLAAILRQRTLEDVSPTDHPPRENPPPDRPDLPRLLSVFGQISQTLAYAHSRGVIHRDLKPGNVMVGAFAEVQVMDWGLAKHLAPGTEGVLDPAPECSDNDAQAPEPIAPLDPNVSGGMSRTGDVLGTPAYMAPEQARGEVRTLDTRTDVFGLGAILCEILTGFPAFRAGVGRHPLIQAANGDVQDAFQRLDWCGADPELVELAKKCLAPTQQARLANAAEVADAVSRYEQQVQARLKQAELERAEARVQTQEERKRREVEAGKAKAERNRQRMTLAFAVAFVLLVVAGSLAFVIHQDRQAAAVLERESKQRQIEDALQAVTNEHQKLREELRQEGGVFRLLNDPAGWKKRIAIMQGNLARAEKLKQEMKTPLGPELTARWAEVKRACEADKRHCDVAVNMSDIRDEMTRFFAGNFQVMKSLKKYPQTFQAAGFDVLKGDLDDLVVRMKRSPIREQFQAALCEWALVFWFQKRMENVTFPIRRWWVRNPVSNIQPTLVRILRLARGLEDREWGKRVYDPDIGSNVQKLRELADELLQDEQKFRKQSRQTLALIGVLLSYHADKSAVRWMRLVRRQYPEDFWMNFGTGFALFRARDALKGQPELFDAPGYYRAALAVRPKSTVGWLFLGMILVHLERYEEAVAAYNKATDLDPTLQKAWSFRADILFRLKKYGEATACRWRALELDPDATAASWIQLGETVYRTGNYLEAAKVFRKAREVDKDSGDPPYHLGRAFWKLKDYPRAEKYFRVAANRKPRYKWAWLGLAQALARQGKHREAAEAFRKMTKIDPEYRYAWYQMAKALCAQHKYQAASVAYDQSAQVHRRQGNSTPYTRLAFQGRYNAACSAVLASKADDSTKPDPKDQAKLRQRALGWLRQELKDCRSLVNNPPQFLLVIDHIDAWHTDEALESVRNANDLAKLTPKEQEGWNRLWSEMADFRKAIRLRYTKRQFEGRLSHPTQEMSHTIEISSGTTYLFEMKSDDFDPHLRLHHSQGRKIAENNDISKTNHDAVFVIIPRRNVTGRLVDTSHNSQGKGAYRIVVRAFAPPPNN